MSLIPFREIETWSMFHRVSNRHFLSAGQGWAQAACYVALGLGGILVCCHKATLDAFCCPVLHLGPNSCVAPQDLIEVDVFDPVIIAGLCLQQRVQEISVTAECRPQAIRRWWAEKIKS